MPAPTLDNKDIDKVAIIVGQHPQHCLLSMTNTNTSASGFNEALAASQRKFVIAFSGQGSEYWHELHTLYNQSQQCQQEPTGLDGQDDSARTLIDLVADALFRESQSDEARASPAFERVIELRSWLQQQQRSSRQENTDKTDSGSFVATVTPGSDTTDDGKSTAVAPVAWERACFSYPLIALTQAANYLAFLTTAGVRHEDVLQHTRCTVGLSQGVTVAAVFATARTNSEFVELAVRLVRYLFWHGLRAQEAFTNVDSATLSVSVRGASSTPTPMLAVTGLPTEQIHRTMAAVASRSGANDLQLSLVHEEEKVCVTGLPSTLELLRSSLSPLLSKAVEDQTRVPFSQRKPSGDLAFVAVSCPFHSALLAPAKATILSDIERRGAAMPTLSGSLLQCPVYSTAGDARNLQSLGDADLVPLLVDMQLTELADWRATLKTVQQNHHDATHLLDFGSGAGVTRLVGSTLEGIGIDVVGATAKHESYLAMAPQRPVVALSRFLMDGTASCAHEKSWESRFAPYLSSTGKLENKFTRTLKTPPVVVGGMNPTTSSRGVDLVAAITNAGFSCELAGGGTHRLVDFEASVLDAAARIRPGHGLAINMVYFNTKQWAFQFPAVLRMRKSGVPIRSVTIGAGVPTTDRALEIIHDLQAVGINTIAFKPGSSEGIQSALDIARASPSMCVVLQWTGGRAGGHHSFEDFHRPLESAYAAIRREDNVLLVVGSGFGDWKDSYPYLTGEWSLARGHGVKMPVDAILLGSRVMVAKEAATTDEVKQLLVATQGVATEPEWELSYSGSAGGIMTVVSEYGEPVHKVANRGVRLWREFDNKYFSKPRGDMERAVRRDKSEIIARLNADFQKPYFGLEKRDPVTGETRCAELEEMTYSEVLSRLVALMFVDIPDRPKRWIHGDYIERVSKFLRRTQQRFKRRANSNDPFVFDQQELEVDPHTVLARFVSANPRAVTTLLSIPDRDFFLQFCRSGGKPVNFVPVIDGELRTYFKKDSLWYSEDLDAVPGRDVQRVCILQGPVAVRYSTVINEPVAKILGGILDGFTKNTRRSSEVVKCPPHAVAAVRSVSLCGFPVLYQDDCRRVTIPPYVGSLPDAKQWLDALSELASERDWLATLISTEYVVEDEAWIPSPVRKLLQPRGGLTFVLSSLGLGIFDAAVDMSTPTAQIHREAADKAIVLRMNEMRPQTPRLKADIISLETEFFYSPALACPIQIESRNIVRDKVKRFFARFLVAEDGNEAASCAAACEARIHSTFTDEFVVSEKDIAAYRAALALKPDGVNTPADFVFVAAWKAVIKPLLAKDLAANVLNVVHLNYSCKLLSSSLSRAREAFVPGDHIVSFATVTGVRITSSGKIVSSVIVVSKKKKKLTSRQQPSARVDGEACDDELEPLIEVRNEFLVRARFSDFSSAFTVESSVERVTLQTTDDVQLLLSKSWLSLESDVMSASPLAVGDALELDLKTTRRYTGMDQLSSLTVSGSVRRLGVGSSAERIGSVHIDSSSLRDSPINALLRQLQQTPATASNTNSSPADDGHNVFAVPIAIQVPESALAYAVASRDLNPIHRSVNCVMIGALPKGTPVMHGMWIAAKARSLVAEHFAGGVDTNIVDYEVSFDGIVYPGDQLFLQVRHAGHSDGMKTLVVEVANARGERVLTARARAKMPPCAFVFTGQGSAKVGMGMALYERSAVAREIWNRGDRHLKNRFGFSILDIVRSNPETVRIHFGGKRGRAYRENFMRLTRGDRDHGEMTALVPEITSRSQSFVFSAPGGLLFATQFTQPALVLFERAAFAEIEAAELVPEHSLFAGHSLGEYAALASVAGVMEIEDAVELVFLRGIISQRAVPRAASDRSSYAMVAVDPSRAGDFVTEETVSAVVNEISETSGKLLQVVNFNVRGRQLVVAGDVVNLEALSISLAVFRSLKVPVNIDTVITEALEQAAMKQEACVANGERFELTRGAATIPLPGIDVPFHSRALHGDVPTLRSLLRPRLHPHVLARQLPQLLGRYIPNLTGTPFSLERSYFEQVVEMTKSPFIAQVLEPERWAVASQAHLAHVLLVELLAYQLASPVQWIKTQEVLFSSGSSGVDRCIEVGPEPTLSNMALRAMQVGSSVSRSSRQVLWYERDRDAVRFEEENAHPSASEYARSLRRPSGPQQKSGVVSQVAEVPAVVVAPAVAAAMPPAVQASATVTTVASASALDMPVSALHVLRVLLAVRLNRNIADIHDSTNLKTLCAGKSALQNEVLGDLEKEFGARAPDGAESMPLLELAPSFAQYTRLGRLTTGMIAKMLSAKMPGGLAVSGVKTHLSSAKCLGPGRVESVLAHALLAPPQTRLRTEADAHEWLDTMVNAYAAFAGVSLSALVAAATQLQAPVGLSAAAVPTVLSVPDRPVDAKHALKVLLATKLSRRLSELPDDATIKQLSGAKSALQNEIASDVEKEFGACPDDVVDMALTSVAELFPAYASLGKVSSSLIAKMVAGSMPGGFGLGAMKQHLSSERCLPPGRVDSVLLHALTQSPNQRLGDAGQARSWLDGVADDNAQFFGVEIPYASKLHYAGGSTSAHVAGAVMSADLDARMKSLVLDQVKQLSSGDLLDASMESRVRADAEADLREQLEARVADWEDEHGSDYETGVASMFDHQKERRYESFWNWAKQDTVELYNRLVRTSTVLSRGPTELIPTETDLDTLLEWLERHEDNSGTNDSLPAQTRSSSANWRNRTTPEVLQSVRFYASRAEKDGHVIAARVMRLLADEISDATEEDPVALITLRPTQPEVRILETGKAVYVELPRVGVSNSVEYVRELARGLQYLDDDSASRSDEEVSIQAAANEQNNSWVGGTSSSHDGTDEDEDFGIVCVSRRRSDPLTQQSDATDRTNTSSFEARETTALRGAQLHDALKQDASRIVLPHVYIRIVSEIDPTLRLFDAEATSMLLACMHEMASTGISFAGKVALVTGCGLNSIGAEVVKTLLEGGATVFVTTSSFSMATTSAFRKVYEEHGSRGSRLIVLPSNLASKKDVKLLVDHIYSEHHLDLDFVVPFAALSEVGNTIGEIESRSEVAHRLMLTNVVRLLGEVGTAKKTRGITSHPALVLLPMSINRGSFGGDGLYTESKLGLESLMAKWYSEDWSDQLLITGAVIGWVRATGLMEGNNDAAAGFEERMKTRTFNTAEMAFNITALMHPDVVEMAVDAPLWADLSGGTTQVRFLKQNVDAARADVMRKTKVQAAIYQSKQQDDQLLESSLTIAATQQELNAAADMSRYLCDTFPDLSATQALAETPEQTLLRGMIDLRKVVVVVGYGEVGPWGNARTRWEMESYGEFSLEGCIELAWLTGRIEYENGNWVDARSREIVGDLEVKARYEDDILKHAGIRIIEPELFDGYDPRNKIMMHQVAIDKKMAPIEVADREEALQLRQGIGEECVDVFETATGVWMVRLREGSVISVPRSLSFDRFVAGQIPTGWSAEHLGLPKDIADSVDPVTLFTLASTVEAIVAAGITDPYEFYKYVHVSEVGNTSGGAVGGLRALRGVFRERHEGKTLSSDILQEAFINTTPAWVNMLLLSSSGPIKTPVGACATSAESVEIGVETIKSGKARVVVVGGFDDFGEEGTYEFAQMKTTSDSVKETAMGREPREMCRPCSSTRGGFMESHGSGTQLLMDAQLALDMGCPIYSIVALTNTATDKTGRSVPAPGQGILTTARETSGMPSPSLDLAFRRRQFDAEVASVDAWFALESSLAVREGRERSHVQYLEQVKQRKVQSAQAMWGQSFFQGCNDIAPVRGALSVWNLTIDDIGVASFHGTGTKGNDRNESEVTQKQLEHLGRATGNVLPVVCQKHLTGHSKGAAAAYMINGLLQVLNSGLIPGNQNLDNTDESLRQFDLLVYPNRSIQTPGIKAAVMKSFGFGQAGAEVLLVHPDYLLATLDDDAFSVYVSGRAKRMQRMNTYVQNTLTGKHPFIQVKTAPPYSSEQESSVYLDPTARARFDAESNTWKFSDVVERQTSSCESLLATAASTAAARHVSTVSNSRTTALVRSSSGSGANAIASTASSANTGLTNQLLTALNQSSAVVSSSANSIGRERVGLGVDVEPVVTFERLDGREDFIKRNFTEQEMAYCYSAPHPAASFAGRWAAKEAVVKAISSAAPNDPSGWKSAGAPLREIEVVRSASGAPVVELSGLPLMLFRRLGLASLTVSISHTSDFAVAQAIASFVLSDSKSGETLAVEATTTSGLSIGSRAGVAA